MDSAAVVEQDDDQVFAAALEGAMAFPATAGEMATRVEAVALRTGQTPDTEPELIPATGQETSQVELRELRERVGHLAQQNRELRLQMEAMAPSSRSTGEGSGSVSRAERLCLENPNLMYMNSDMDPTGNVPERQVRGAQPNLGEELRREATVGGVSDVSHDLLDLGEDQARMIGDGRVQQATTLPGVERAVTLGHSPVRGEPVEDTHSRQVVFTGNVGLETSLQAWTPWTAGPDNQVGEGSFQTPEPPQPCQSWSPWVGSPLQDGLIRSDAQPARLTRDDPLVQALFAPPAALPEYRSGYDIVLERERREARVAIGLPPSTESGETREGWNTARSGSGRVDGGSLREREISDLMRRLGEPMPLGRGEGLGVPRLRLPLTPGQVSAQPLPLQGQPGQVSAQPLPLQGQPGQVSAQPCHGKVNQVRFPHSRCKVNQVRFQHSRCKVNRSGFRAAAARSTRSGFRDAFSKAGGSRIRCAASRSSKPRCRAFFRANASRARCIAFPRSRSSKPRCRAFFRSGRLRSSASSRSRSGRSRCITLPRSG